MSLSVLPDFNNIPDDILDFLKFLKSKNLVKFRSEWKTIVLNIHEKYSSLLTKNINNDKKEIERNKRLIKKKSSEIQECRLELRDLGFVHLFSSRDLKNKKRQLEEKISSIKKYLSYQNKHPFSGSGDNIEKTLHKRFLKEYEKEELKFFKSKLTKEEFKKYKSAINVYLVLKHPYNYDSSFLVTINSTTFEKLTEALGSYKDLKLKDTSKPKGKPSKEEVVKQYKIEDDMPGSLDVNVEGKKLFKRDMTGLLEYFKEMPNMERIYNEFTQAIRNGYTVEKYLNNANLINDDEIRSIAGKGFDIIAGFLKDMLKIQDNPELKKDFEACIEAKNILLNN